VDTILIAFRVAEDERVRLPATVAADGFVTSHALMEVDLPDQELVDRFLPPCRLPQQLNADRPVTVGGLTWPRDTQRHRIELQKAMERVPGVLEEALDEFEEVFGRRPHGTVDAEQTSDADVVLIACSTMARTVRDVVGTQRERGKRVGMVKNKLFRPIPRGDIAAAIGSAKKVGVLDRNHSPGSGGIFWQEVVASLRSRPDVMVQGYLVGLGGGDVTTKHIEGIVDDLALRKRTDEPIWIEVSE
jgi:pyruvate/2-oxoacid:ferredoxin oxidoreductase alpha subunit